MKYLKYALGLAVLLYANNVSAGSTCKINTAKDVLDCAVEHNPNIARSKSQVSIASINKEISGRYLNPDLEITGGYSKEEADRKGILMGVAIMQPIETPTKRKAKIDRASAELSSVTAGLENQKEIAAVQVLTIMNRLRQIEKEKAALNETITAFSNVIKKYGSQAALSYEDQISTDLFRLALNNYQIERNQLIAEEKSYVANLKSILNSDIKMSRKLFYYPPKNWPKVKGDAAVDNSVDLAIEKANIASSRAEFLEAKSSSFGGFSVGPYMNTRPGSLGTTDEYGLKFSMPIPIYSNKKSVSAGRMAVNAAEQSFDAKRRELEFGYASLKEQYDNGIKALRRYNINNVEKKHSQTETLFGTGRVSGSVLIEAHRQMLDSIRIYHQYELETLQSLWRIYAIQRNLLTNISEVSYVKN